MVAVAPLPNAELPPALPNLNAILALSKSGETVRTLRSTIPRLLLTLGELAVVAKECRRGTDGLPLKSLNVRSSILAKNVGARSWKDSVSLAKHHAVGLTLKRASIELVCVCSVELVALVKASCFQAP